MYRLRGILDKTIESVWCTLRFHFRIFINLLRIRGNTEPDDYKNFLRMDENSFDTLLALIRPDIEKQDTVMRRAIPGSQRLSVTLRYLASGMDLDDLKFTCAIASRTLGIVIMETCEAIIKKLRDYIQIPKNTQGWEEVAQEF